MTEMEHFYIPGKHAEKIAKILMEKERELGVPLRIERIDYAGMSTDGQSHLFNVILKLDVARHSGVNG